MSSDVLVVYCLLYMMVKAIGSLLHYYKYTCDYNAIRYGVQDDDSTFFAIRLLILLYVWVCISLTYGKYLHESPE